MEFWVILDGEKAGPLQDYEIRSRIDRRELTRETPAWHQGMPVWRTLGEIALFESEFRQLDDEDAREAEVVRSPGSGPDAGAFAGRPPPLPGPVVFGRRFWARWLDIHVYLAVWWLGMWVGGRPIGAVMNSLPLMVVQLVPWFILEAVLLNRFGATPGKWLLGLSVANADGSRLGLGPATVRSFRILIGGIGFGWGLLALICQAFSFYTARRIGRPLWDHAGGHVVRAQPLEPWKVAVVVVALFVAIQAQMAVISPYVLKNAAETFPSLREALEKNPPWHLPQHD